MSSTITKISSRQLDLDIDEPSAPPPEPVEPDSEDYSDWWSENSETIAIHAQPETAIYFNDLGGLVIRQRDGLFEDDEDQAVMIRPENIGPFLAKLADMCGLSLRSKP